MRDDVKGVSKKAERDIEKSTAVKKEDDLPSWKEIGIRVGAMVAMTVAAVINYPEISAFERMQYVMVWMIWAELFVISTMMMRRR